LQRFASPVSRPAYMYLVFLLQLGKHVTQSIMVNIYANRIMDFDESRSLPECTSMKLYHTYHSVLGLTASSISNPTIAPHDYLVMMDSGYEQVCVIGVLSKPEVNSCSIVCLVIRSFGYKRLNANSPIKSHRYPPGYLGSKFRQTCCPPLLNVFRAKSRGFRVRHKLGVS
jgi:hypothetical protein